MQANGYERVLERCPGARVGVDVAGRHARHPKPRGEACKTEKESFLFRAFSVRALTHLHGSDTLLSLLSLSYCI